MSESIIADFVGKFNADVLTSAEPVNGRILLSRKRLVLAANESNKLTIPLSSIFDIAVGHVPPGLGDFFQSTVTIAFERGGSRHTAVIEAEDGKISKFSTVLFKAILTGTEASVKRRARVGGRVTDEEFANAKLSLTPSTVEFRGQNDPFEISLDSVTGFQRPTREIGGSTRPILAIRHTMGDTAVTTEITLPSSRKMSVLGRFLRLEYSDLVQELQDIELSREQTEILVAIYAMGGVAPGRLETIVSAESAQIPTHLGELAEVGLVEDSGDGPVLTPVGHAAVNRNIEDVTE